MNPDRLAGLHCSSDDDVDPMPPLGEAPDGDVGGFGLQNGFKDVCPIIALQSLGFPISCDRDGPFSILFGNTLLLPFGVQLRYKHCGKSLPDGSYIVRDASMQHLFSLQCREGLIAKKDAHVTSVVSASSAMDMLSSENYTFYFLRRRVRSEPVMFDVVGGAEPQAFICPL